MKRTIRQTKKEDAADPRVILAGESKIILKSRDAGIGESRSSFIHLAEESYCADQDRDSSLSRY